MYCTKTKHIITFDFVMLLQARGNAVPSNPKQALKCLMQFGRDVFPTLCIAYRLLLTIGFSIASCERSFSNRRDGVVVRASASQSVDLGFIPLVESYQKTLKNGIYSFPAWRSAFMGGCGEQAGKFACCVLGQGT